MKLISNNPDLPIVGEVWIFVDSRIFWRHRKPHIRAGKRHSRVWTRRAYCVANGVHTSSTTCRKSTSGEHSHQLFTADIWRSFEYNCNQAPHQCCRASPTECIAHSRLQGEHTGSHRQTAHSHFSAFGLNLSCR